MLAHGGLRSLPRYNSGYGSCHYARLFAGRPWSWAQKAPFDIQAMMKVRGSAIPQLSPDGRTVAFTVQRVDLESNTKPTHIYVVPLAGGAPGRSPRKASLNERPRWSPDSRQIAFVSDRSGSSQVWMMNADGSGAKQVTNLSTEAGGVLFSPDGKRLVFTSEVYPDCADEACNKKRLDAEKASKVKARVYTSLLYRHWTQWQGERRRHLFAIDVDGRRAQGSHTRDARRPAVLPGRSGRLRHLARRQGTLLRDESRSGTRRQHQLGSLRRADGRGPADEDHQQRGSGQLAAVLAERQVSRLPLAVARRL